MTQKPIIAIVLVALISALGILFFWWPKYQDFSDLRRKLEEKKAELQNKKEYFSELENLSNRLKEYSQEISKIESALPVKPSFPELLNFVEKISAQNGLILQKVNIGNISQLEQEPGIFKIPLTISLTGSYPAFKNFLSTLQNNARLIEVEQASFVVPQVGTVFTFDLKIRAHSYAEASR